MPRARGAISLESGSFGLELFDGQTLVDERLLVGELFPIGDRVPPKEDREDRSSSPPAASRVVEEVLRRSKPIWFIALTLVKMRVDDLAEWIREFNEAHLRISRALKLDRSAPSVVVFVKDLSFADRSLLHKAGAVVFDESVGAMKDASALLAWLKLTLPTSSPTVGLESPAFPEVPGKVLPQQRPLSKSDHAAANQYPPDVSRESLSAAIDASNRGPN